MLPLLFLFKKGPISLQCECCLGEERVGGDIVIRGLFGHTYQSLVILGLFKVYLKLSTGQIENGIRVCSTETHTSN